MLSVFFIYLVIVFLIGTFASRFMSKKRRRILSG